LKASQIHLIANPIAPPYLLINVSIPHRIFEVSSAISTHASAKVSLIVPCNLFNMFAKLAPVLTASHWALAVLSRYN
jgi:hypothetical protein